MTATDRKAAIVTELRKRARACATITPGDLGTRVGLAPQGPWQALLDAIDADEHAAGRPGLACLVVHQDTGLPGHVGSDEAARRAAMEARQRVFEAYWNGPSFDLV